MVVRAEASVVAESVVGCLGVEVMRAARAAAETAAAVMGVAAAVVQAAAASVGAAQTGVAAMWVEVAMVVAASWEEGAAGPFLAGTGAATAGRVADSGGVAMAAGSRAHTSVR